jgi:hypothetical protein
MKSSMRRCSFGAATDSGSNSPGAEPRGTCPAIFAGKSEQHRFTERRAKPCARARSGTERHAPRRQLAPRPAIDDDGLDPPPARGIGALDDGTARREPAVSPRREREQDAREIASLVREHVFLAGRVLFVQSPFQDAVLDEALEPSRQRIRRDPESLFEVLKASRAEQGISNDEQRPAVAHLIKGPRNRALHVRKALSLHRRGR